VHTSNRFLDQKISPCPLHPHNSTTTCPDPPTAPEEPPEQNGSGLAIQPTNLPSRNTPQTLRSHQASSKSPAKSIHQLHPSPHPQSHFSKSPPLLKFQPSPCIALLTALRLIVCTDPQLNEGPFSTRRWTQF
jgi:hypothetical protein